MLDITLLVGRLEPYNKHRVDELEEEHKPFVEEFSKFYAFQKWVRDVKKPLLKDRYLAIIREELTMGVLENRITQLKAITNPYVKVLLVVTPRERLYNLDFPDVEIVNLNITALDDFKKMIEIDLDPIPVEGIEAVVRRIGLSYKTYILYQEELKALKYKDAVSIAGVIKEKRISPVETILLGLLNREKKFIKEHYQLCDKYSEGWVINYYKSTLNLTLWLKSKVQSGEMSLTDIRISDKYSRMLGLVKNSRITDVFVLRSLLKFNDTPVETFVLSLTTNNYLKFEQTKMEDTCTFNVYD